MSDYATTSELYAYAYQKVTGDETLLAAALTRASRLIDRACGLPDNYFAKGDTGQTASVRKYWGDGTDYLKVDPYLASSITAVTMPTGFTVPDYEEANHNSRPQLAMPGEFYLVRVYGDNEARFSSLSERQDLFPAEFSGQLDYVGWPDGIRVQITAKYGFDEVPSDIKEATIETAIAIWRGRDVAFSRAVGIEGAGVVINNALPERAKLVADTYRAGRFMFA